MAAARRIAAHLLWRPEEGFVRDPLVTLSPEGRLLAVSTCAEPDRLAATEFHAGLLVTDFPADYAAVFAAMCRDGRPLAEQLPQRVPAPGGCTVVLSGLDYDGLRLTPRSQIVRL